MQLVLSEDQELISKTVGDFVEERSPVSRFRALRDSNDDTGYSKALWKEMAELGWVGISIPEEYGGAGMGLADLAIVLEGLGSRLAPEPFFSTVLLGGQMLIRGGTKDQQGTWLPGIAAGEKIISLAYQELGSRYDLNVVETRAEDINNGFSITGEKILVLDGHVSDGFLVVARTAGDSRSSEGISIFLVPSDADGLVVTRQTRVDFRNSAVVSLSGVFVQRNALVGELHRGATLLEDVVDYATAGLCSEMLGGMQQAFKLTMDHVKERKQFETAVGSFQALKHRAADIFIELELARSATMACTRAIDEESENSSKLVSLAKARCSDAYLLASNEGVQMFGGVGMTDEYDIGLYLKRARACELTFGDSSFHRNRWALLGGY